MHFKLQKNFRLHYVKEEMKKKVYVIQFTIDFDMTLRTLIQTHVVQGAYKYNTMSLYMRKCERDEKCIENCPLQGHTRFSSFLINKFLKKKKKILFLISIIK